MGFLVVGLGAISGIALLCALVVHDRKSHAPRVTTRSALFGSLLAVTMAVIITALFVVSGDVIHLPLAAFLWGVASLVLVAWRVNKSGGPG